MGIFSWFKPDEADRTVGEISNDAGDHIVFDVPAKDEGTVRRIMRENNIEGDRDEQLSRQYNAAERVSRRDPDQHRYRMQKVVDPHEDLEAEQDDDSIAEHDEQAASGGWFSWW